MSTVQEIEQAIRELSPSELAKVRALLAELVDGKTRGLEADQGLASLERAREKEERLKELIEKQEKLLSDARNSIGDAVVKSPPSAPRAVVQPAKYHSIDEWLVAFRKWGESHEDITAIADDSRESIY
jgi:hypothetical protein